MVCNAISGVTCCNTMDAAYIAMLPTWLLQPYMASLPTCTSIFSVDKFGKTVDQRQCVIDIVFNHSMPQHILSSLFNGQPVIWKNIDASQATRCNLKGFEALAD